MPVSIGTRQAGTKEKKKKKEAEMEMGGGGKYYSNLK